MPSRSLLMLLLGSSKLYGSLQEGGRKHAHVPNPSRLLPALTRCNPSPQLKPQNGGRRRLRQPSLPTTPREMWALDCPSGAVLWVPRISTQRVVSKILPGFYWKFASQCPLLANHGLHPGGGGPRSHLQCTFNPGQIAACNPTWPGTPPTEISKLSLSCPVQGLRSSSPAHTVQEHANPSPFWPRLHRGSGSTCWAPGVHPATAEQLPVALAGPLVLAAGTCPQGVCVMVHYYSLGVMHAPATHCTCKHPLFKDR